MNNLQQRIFESGIALIVSLVIVFFSSYSFFKPFFALFISAAIGLALWEYYQITKVKGHRPITKIGVTTSVIYTMAVFINTQYSWAYLLPSLVLACAFLICFLYFFIRETKPLDSLAVTQFGIAYLTIPLTCAVSIVYFFQHGSQDGRWWLFYTLLVTKMTDTGAYIVGKLFGKRQLAAYISPKKTIEGAVGGIVSAILTSLFLPAFASWISPHSFTLGIIESIYLGTTIGILAQIGDLGESLLKRDAGIKDSNQLPGLGGALDIVDSLIFTTPFIYFYINFQGQLR